MKLLVPSHTGKLRTGSASDLSCLPLVPGPLRPTLCGTGQQGRSLRGRREQVKG